ncbi:hypothetical protein EI555_006165 [Monodon monoceros]|uniref:C2 domain-containing protein n=1 Tax=Monodon monoceros TaxID=40151 RepID=A0A4U1ER04_MONMO|nr:hypothetical protein EI555_006165 [Monodon monoceros]
MVTLKSGGQGEEEQVKAVLHNPHSQELEIEVFDEDLDKDDFLGRCKVSLTTVLNNGFLDEWLTLEDVSSGCLHLRLTPHPTAAELEEVLQMNHLIQTEKSEELAAALLSVYLERAEDLQLRKAPELRQRLTHSDSPLEAPAWTLGQVKLTVWYYSEERKLVSIVHSCWALRQNGQYPPDPYVSLLLLPDKNWGTKRKSSQKKRTLNPEFNE